MWVFSKDRPRSASPSTLKATDTLKATEIYKSISKYKAICIDLDILLSPHIHHPARVHPVVRVQGAFDGA